jgi:hypothetical protein
MMTYVFKNLANKITLHDFFDFRNDHFGTEEMKADVNNMTHLDIFGLKPEEIWFQF